jgi:hypothetical protein
MDDLLYTAALPFKHKGIDSMKEHEFVMTLSMDLNWFKPETARAFIDTAVEKGILSREKDMLNAQFSIDDINIPMGFKPDPASVEEKDVFEQIVERIYANTGNEKQKIIAKINQKRNDTKGLFTIEVLGILVAREYDIQVDDLIERAYRNLLGEPGFEGRKEHDW